MSMVTMQEANLDKIDQCRHYQPIPDHIDPYPVDCHDEEVSGSRFVRKEMFECRPVSLIGLLVLDRSGQR